MSCLFSGALQLLCFKFERLMLEDPAKGGTTCEATQKTQQRNSMRVESAICSDSGVSSLNDDENSRFSGISGVSSNPPPDSPYSPSLPILSDLSGGEDSRDSFYGGLNEEEKKACARLNERIRVFKAVENTNKGPIRNALDDLTNQGTPRRPIKTGSSSVPVRRLFPSSPIVREPRQFDFESFSPSSFNENKMVSSFGKTELPKLNFSAYDPCSSTPSESSPSSRFFHCDESSSSNGLRKPLRRTQSEYEGTAGLISRKRPSLSGESCGERKRSRGIQLSLDESHNLSAEIDAVNRSYFDNSPDDSVFLPELSTMSAPSPTSSDDAVFSPDMSHISVVSTGTTQIRSKVSSSMSRPIMRALSTGVLEKGEYAKHDEEGLPKLLEVEYSLPLVRLPNITSQAFRCISGSTLVEEMKKLGEMEFDKKYTLVDCRYEYEFHGGHIKTSVNIFDQTRIPDVFFPGDEAKYHNMKEKIPIFYCEYSQKRGPGMANALRSVDRLRNENNYPHVDYEEIYVLERGYKTFFLEHKFQAFCTPVGYVPMDEPAHQNTLKQHRWHRSKSTSNMAKTGAMGKRRGPARPVSFLSLDQAGTSSPLTSRVRKVSPKMKVAQRLTFDSDESFGPH